MMIELDVAENMLKRAYINAIAEALEEKDRNPVYEKIICSGYGHTYKAPMDKRVGRNDLCPCGSGKKYKRCCMEVSDE